MYVYSLIRFESLHLLKPGTKLILSLTYRILMSLAVLQTLQGGAGGRIVNFERWQITFSLIFWFNNLQFLIEKTYNVVYRSCFVNIEVKKLLWCFLLFLLAWKSLLPTSFELSSWLFCCRFLCCCCRSSFLRFSCFLSLNRFSCFCWLI